MLDRKIITVVTGASSGLGRDLCLELCKDHHIIAVSRSEEKIKELTEEIAGHNRAADYFTADVSRPEDVVALRDYLENKFGYINILVNNAGLGIFKPLVELEDKEWKAMTETMVFGTFLSCKHLIPLILNAHHEDKRHIVINSSYWGIKGDTQSCTGYIAAKFAQRGISLSLREELRSQNVKVTCFLPGSINTPFFDSSSWTHDPQRILSSKELAKVIKDILNYKGNLNVEEIVVQAINPD